MTVRSGLCYICSEQEFYIVHKIALIVDKHGKMTIVQSVKMTYIFKGIGEADCEAVELTIAVE